MKIQASTMTANDAAAIIANHQKTRIANELRAEMAVGIGLRGRVDIPKALLLQVLALLDDNDDAPLGQ